MSLQIHDYTDADDENDDNINTFSTSNLEFISGLPVVDFHLLTVLEIEVEYNPS